MLYHLFQCDQLIDSFADGFGHQAHLLGSVVGATKSIGELLVTPAEMWFVLLQDKLCSLFFDRCSRAIRHRIPRESVH